MLRRLTLPQLLIIAALVVMALTAGAVWQFPGSSETQLRALLPAWVGIVAVFWILWRQIVRHNAETLTLVVPPPLLSADFTPLRLDERYADIASLPLESLEYVVVNTETTGLNVKLDKIVRIRAVRIANGKLLEGDCFERLVNPGRPISRDSNRFHGNTEDPVAHASGIDEILAEFLDYAGDAVLIGHNIAFDLSFLTEAGVVPNASLDTMLLSIAAFPSRRDHTLESLSMHFDEPIQERHISRGDADLTARIFLKLLPEVVRLGAQTFGDAQDLCEYATDKMRDLLPHK